MDYAKEIEVWQKNTLGVDDKFDFKCKQCGGCCRNREDILLSAYDIYRMAKHLNIRPVELVEKHCEVYIGGNSKMPVIRLLPKPHGLVCPLLKSGKCSVHGAKPTVCALFPLGRMMKDGTGKISYFVQRDACGSKGQQHTVKAWLNEFNITESEEFMLKWSDMIMNISKVMQKPPKHIKHSENLVLDFLASFMYLKYETDKEFFPQLDANIEMIKKIIGGSYAGV